MDVRTDPEYYFRDTEDFPFPEVFEVDHVWEILDESREVMREEVDGRNLEAAMKPPHTRIVGNVYFEDDVEVAPMTYIEGTEDKPVYVGEGSELGPFAHIRPGTLIGRDVEIGKTEVKGSVIRNGVQSGHYGYIGDSVIGRDVNVATNMNTGNLKHTGSNVRVDGRDTGRRKFGCVIGDYSKTGCSTTTQPGALIGPDVWLDAGLVVDGFVPEGQFRKSTEDGYRDVPLKKEYRRFSE